MKIVIFPHFFEFSKETSTVSISKTTQGNHDEETFAGFIYLNANECTETEVIEYPKLSKTE